MEFDRILRAALAILLVAIVAVLVVAPWLASGERQASPP